VFPKKIASQLGNSYGMSDSDIYLILRTPSEETVMECIIFSRNGFRLGEVSFSSLFGFTVFFCPKYKQ